MGSEEERRRRAAERAERMVSARAAGPSATATEHIALATELSRWAWSLTGRPFPTYTRATMPIRVVRGPV